MIHSLSLVLSLVLALTWSGTSEFSSVCRVVCFLAVVGYVVCVLFSILCEGRSEPTIPTKGSILPDLWDRELDRVGGVLFSTEAEGHALQKGPSCTSRRPDR
jgi:hypothetical protein